MSCKETNVRQMKKGKKWRRINPRKTRAYRGRRAWYATLNKAKEKYLDEESNY